MCVCVCVCVFKTFVQRVGKYTHTHIDRIV